MGVPGKKVVLTRNGRPLVDEFGRIKTSTLDENGDLPPGCCCEESPCQTCPTCDTQRGVPTTLYLTLSNVSDEACSQCESFNSTFELTLDTETCSWLFTDGPAVCPEGVPNDPIQIRATLVCDSPTPQIHIEIDYSNGLGFGGGEHGVLTSADFCDAAFDVEDTSEPFLAGGSTRCWFNVATLRVSTSP